MSTKRSPYRSQHKIASLAGSLLLLASACLPTLAAGPIESRLDTMQLNGGTLSLSGAQVIAKPVLDSWSNTTPDGKASTIVILDFPEQAADIAALNRQAGQIMQAHPEVRQLMASPSSSNPKGTQVVLEIYSPPGQAEASPQLVQANPMSWTVQLPGAVNPLAQTSKPAQAAIKPTDALTTIQSQSANEPMSSQPAESSEPRVTRTVKVVEDSKRPALSFLKLSNIFGGEKEAAPQTVSGAENEVASLAQELQNVINERDALEAEVMTLKQTLANRQRGKETMPVDANESIRPIDPALVTDPQMRSEAVIHNLRTALLQVSTKLKDTEAALAEEQAKNRKLAAGMPVHAAPKAAPKPATSDAPNPTSQLSHFQYEKPPVAAAPVKHAAPHTTAASAAVISKEREITLQAALRENPNNPDAYLQLADLYAGRHDLRQSESVLTRLIEKNPGYGQAYYYLALVYLGEKRGLEAQAALDTYRRMSPQDRARIAETQHAIQAALASPAPQKH